MRPTYTAVVVLGIALAHGGALALASAPTDAAALAAREAELLERYRGLERSFLRLADLLEATDPRRAAVLRAAFDRARDEQIGDRLAAIVTLLEQGQLLKAGTSQEDAIAQCRALLALLESGAGERRIADTKREVRAFLGRISKLIARQRDIEGATEAGDSAEELGRRQREAADEARALGSDIDAFARRIDDRGTADAEASDSPPRGADAEGPADRQPPGGAGDGEKPRGENGADRGDSGAEAEVAEEGDDEVARARRTRQRVEAARGRMQKAQERLDDARRRDARQEQEKAVEELETARAELEEILRQLREQEVERLLVQLDARLRAMLRAERSVLADSEKLAAAAGQSDRERQLESARLAREQSAITAEASKAMTLVHDDGSAVAIPQALEQVRDDSAQAAARFGRGDTGPDTLGLVGDIVVGLEEMLAAVEKAQRAQQPEQGGAGGGRAAEAGEQPLVDKLSELKMLRTLQMRVNTRTRRFSRLLDDATDRAEEPELRAVLARLAERQRAIERAARDIVTGLTE
jgi:hypothetical protein